MSNWDLNKICNKEKLKIKKKKSFDMNIIIAFDVFIY